MYIWNIYKNIWNISNVNPVDIRIKLREKTMRKRMERHGTSGGIDLAREGSLYARGAAAGESI